MAKQPDLTPIREAIAQLEHRIEQMYAAAKPEVMRCIERGDYDGERHLRSRLEEAIRPFRQEIIYFKTRLPPHTTWDKRGYFIRNPVELI